MIGYLTGKLLSKQPPLLVLEVNGVGYELEAPLSTFYRLGAVGQVMSLHTHLAVREDAHLLFGFATATEKALFRELIKISGVGPKLALTVLSGSSVDDFWAMLRAGEVSSLTRLPGIGKKTAERLLMELKDKAGADSGVGGGGVAGTGPLQEAKAALLSLGFKPAEVQKLLDAVYDESMSTEQIIQAALRRSAR